MFFVKHALPSLVLTMAVGWGSLAAAAPGIDRSGGSAFRQNDASAIGRARQHFDRQQYDRYRGNPGAQFQLRQKRRNLCRNVPEMC